mmetsp:Transcript_16740/g.29295  ORF Transcript_16740/g.29295 Transcript_16740/m.29295 type:complete len:313 (+) Transcript_16740:1783-2721(+)
MSSSGISSIHGSLSSVISKAERSFLVFRVPPIICTKARCPASFSLSWRNRSSSLAAASASFFFSSAEMNFSATISSSFTFRTESASSTFCSLGSGTCSSICSSPRIALMRVVFSLMPSMMFALSDWQALKSSLKWALYSAESDWRRLICRRLLELVTSSNGSYRKSCSMVTIASTVLPRSISPAPALPPASSFFASPPPLSLSLLSLLSFAFSASFSAFSLAICAILFSSASASANCLALDSAALVPAAGHQFTMYRSRPVAKLSSSRTRSLRSSAGHSGPLSICHSSFSEFRSTCSFLVTVLSSSLTILSG